MNEELAAHLASLYRDECYRIDNVLKESPYERTETVFFQGYNGSEIGPYIRKRLNCSTSLGQAYERIFTAQQSGMRFVHIPKIVDYHRVGDEITVVMEHVPGKTLQELVENTGPSLQLTADIIPRLCDAVNSLHEGFNPPIIHRDIKPSNIMVNNSNLTLLDFGIARSYQEGLEEDTHHLAKRHPSHKNTQALVRQKPH